MTKNPDDSIRFITSYGREILAQPMIQDMEAFRQALGLAPKEVQVTPAGVVQVNTGEDRRPRMGGVWSWFILVVNSRPFMQ